MVKKKNLEKGYDSVSRNIDFSHVRKHQRHPSKRRTKKYFVFDIGCLREEKYEMSYDIYY